MLLPRRRRQNKSCPNKRARKTTSTQILRRLKNSTSKRRLQIEQDVFMLPRSRNSTKKLRSKLWQMDSFIRTGRDLSLTQTKK